MAPLCPDALYMWLRKKGEIESEKTVGKSEDEGEGTCSGKECSWSGQENIYQKLIRGHRSLYSYLKTTESKHQTKQPHNSTFGESVL